MKKLSIGDMMTYWGIDYVRKTAGTFLAVKHTDTRRDSATGISTLDAMHNLVSKLKTAKA